MANDSEFQYHDIPQVREFPAGGWSIIWHGRVSRNSDIASEPTIELHIRSHHADKVIRVGSGQFPLFKIGTFWNDGRLTTSTASKIENFNLPDIFITPDNLREIEAWDKIAESNYAINPNKLKIPFAAAKSKCLAIKYNNDPYGIIIPASEIARFYYCNSTDLAHSAFWGEYSFARDKIVNPNKTLYDEENDRAVVHLRQKFADLDAWTIGRILFSDTAKKGVQEIHNSLLLNLDTETSGFFNCKIPFMGTTRWKAKGIQMGTKEHPRYLILELLKCSHPFPFSELQVSRDNDSSLADPGTDKPDKEKKPIRRTNSPRNTGSGNKNGQLNRDSEPHIYLPVTNVLNKSAQFDFIEGEEIIKVKDKEFNEYKSVPNKPDTPEPTGLGTGQGDYRNDSTNERAKIRRTIGVGADLQMLTEAVNQLSAEGMNIKIRHVSEMPLSAPKSKRQWAYLDSFFEAKRKYIAIDVKQGNTHYCWIDIEQRRKGECTVGLLSGKQEIGDETLLLILKNLSRLKGIWEGSNGSAVSDIEHIKLDKVLHTWDSSTKLAGIIKQKVSA
ncbi:hypothetical protein [Hydrogenovibrio sp. JE_KL2]|uniref:hypothetical protein n=1 Tax=Hydrogenovibrio sp. JE_KL2 TaxID=2651188 RepID=UPI00128DC9F1|nr:hypothetical protein [Hydrogenovibrio sp. JE_KL2]MPQ76837.1 hypothetical protein [Hydrogenovibrio sp. JE_KL2]